MLLDELVSLIETLQRRIREHGSRLRENETRTRMALIDPLLQTLGWETADPGMVIPEYNVSRQSADYALVGHDGKPAATVEAKKLGESLETHKMQMLNYSNASGVAYAGLTDGNHWELYEVFKRGQLEDRQILKVSIADRPSHESALQLLLLWRPNLASGQPVPANKPILPPVHPERTTSPNAPREPLKSQQIPPPSGWVALLSYDPQPGTASPSAIRFSDGSERAIRNWKNLLAVTIRWLYERSLLTEKNARVSFVNTKNSRENPFQRPTPVDGTPFAFEGNVSGKTVRKRTQQLLKDCGENPGDVFVLPKHTERTPSINIPREPQESQPIPTATPPSGWVALSSYDPQRGTASPSAIRFSDGSERAIRNWKNLLAVTIRWLYERSLLTEKNARVSFVNTKNSRENPFQRPTPVDGTPFAFEGYVNGETVRKRTQRLLKHCGQNPDDVFVLPG